MLPCLDCAAVESRKTGNRQYGDAEREMHQMLPMRNSVVRLSPYGSEMIENGRIVCVCAKCANLNYKFYDEYIPPPLHFKQSVNIRLWKIASAELLSRWVYRYCKMVALMCPWSFFSACCYADLLP